MPHVVLGLVTLLVHWISLGFVKPEWYRCKSCKRVFESAQTSEH
ncbi:MAG: hypothetical protein AAGI17_06430 [Planctomycetota bacterium]